jgi:putative thioredoxin
MAGFDVIDFKKEVIDRSHEVPVFVDFWAEWCGPCKMIAPVLEKLAAEADGKWELRKVDTEANQELAAEWGIQSIPNMKLFADGKVVAELSGALPEYQLKQWLDDHLPTEGKKLVAEAAKLVEQGRKDQAIITYEKALTLESSNQEARMELAKLLIFEQPERVQELVLPLKHLPEVMQLKDLADTLVNADLPEGRQKDTVQEAVAAIKSGDLDFALDKLIQSIMADKEYANQLARRLVVSLFFLLGEEHEFTKKFRRKFSMALY